MNTSAYVIGLDFGTDSVRSIIVNASTGEQVAEASFLYPRWKEKKFSDAAINCYRQHPLDYIEGIEAVVTSCIKQAGTEVARNIKSIGIDATGSTPVAVDKAGTPLSLLPSFSENKNAMFVLWKDHTAVKEADEINQHAKRFEIDFLKYMGGTYSSEWFWSKLLHILRTDEAVGKYCYSWVEQSDWIPFLLTGGTDVHQMKRNRCAAGHKSGWAAEFNGLPPQKFWSSLDPLLEDVSSRMFTESFTSDQVAGTLSIEWAAKLGLNTDVLVAVGVLDAHAGAIGAQVEPYNLCKIIGTSTCDIMVVPKEEMTNKLVNGICGQVDGSVVPGMIGLEAGQSAFGDIYAWFQQLLLWPIEEGLDGAAMDCEMTEKLKIEIKANFFKQLEAQAAVIPLDEESELAIDWFNGRRTPVANQKLKGSLHHLTLGCSAPRLYRALVEGTCFGARKINDCFIEQGVPIHHIIALGGVAKKSPYVMQMLADVLNRSIKVHRSEQACAAGAAMLAAVAAGIHSDLSTAMQKMGAGFERIYKPNPKAVEIYERRYQLYNQLAVQQEQASVKTDLVNHPLLA